ncbi:MAG TPA: cupin domain-containing protein [Mycobacteriales bacterium]|nr:cupin domain-containing protein [Mycobacteriales bacterium]
MSRITYALFAGAAIGLSAVVTATLGCFPATASPGSGASGTVVAQGTTGDQVHVQSTGATRMVYQRVTIQPNGFTGWHTHPGPLLVVVESGTLTHYDRHCNVATYHAGDAFEETPGANAVHMGANYGAEPVVLDVTYILPADAPLRDEADAPACASDGLARS